MYPFCKKYIYEEKFGTNVRVTGDYAGLHLLFSYYRDFNEQDAEALINAGVAVDFVEDYSIMKGKHKNELVLGYGELSFSEIEKGVKRMKKVLE